MTASQIFVDLPALAAHLRQVLEEKKTILLYGYNGTGKTRLSMAFKEIGKQGQGDEEARDTLYFNAFTEDLFHWDNDLDGDSDRRLRLNADSRFFAGLAEMEMDNRIRLAGRRAQPACQPALAGVLRGLYRRSGCPASARSSTSGGDSPCRGLEPAR